MLWCFCTDNPSKDEPVTPQDRGIFVGLRDFPAAQESLKSPYSNYPPLYFVKGDRIQLVENHVECMIGYVESDPTKALGWLPSDALEFISQANLAVYSVCTFSDPFQTFEEKKSRNYLSEIVVEPLTLEMFRFAFNPDAERSEASPTIPTKGRSHS